MARRSVEGSGARHVLVHPDDLGAFILAHAGHHIICHNASFDYWVIHEHLRRHHRKALAVWWDIPDESRLHDTMLLDALIRLARNDQFLIPQNLGVVAKRYTGLFNFPECVSESRFCLVLCYRGRASRSESLMKTGENTPTFPSLNCSNPSVSPPARSGINATDSYPSV